MKYIQVILSLLVLASASFARLPYPIIFVHGITGSQETFRASIEEIQQYADLGDPYVYHVCLNHDGEDEEALSRDDVVICGWTNFNEDLSQEDIMERPPQEAQLFAINFKEEVFSELWDGHDGHLHSNTAAIVKQGYALRSMIAEVLVATRASKVILVGHSMGGLAIREYLQRTDEDGNHVNWINNHHRVARVATLGTPHLGFNHPFLPLDERIRRDDGGEGNFNSQSEALRDMRYEFVNDDNHFNGVYLFGGNERSIRDNWWFERFREFYNYDVNCNGHLYDEVVGINVTTNEDRGTFDNPDMPLPSDIYYTWVRFHAREEDFSGAVEEAMNHFNLDEGDGDGVVPILHQYLHDGASVSPSGRAISLLFNANHLQEGSYIEAVISGMDEPSVINLMYDISHMENQPVQGFSTYQARQNDPDTDCFTLDPTREGIVSLTLNTPPQGNWRFGVINHRGDNVASMNQDSDDFTIEWDPQGEQCIISSVTYPYDGSYEDPYSFTYNIGDQVHLEGGGISNENPTTNTPISFHVRYFGISQPDQVNACVVGYNPISLAPTGHDWRNGVTFSRLFGRIGAGNYRYHFEATVDDSQLRYPEGDEELEFQVTQVLPNLAFRANPTANPNANLTVGDRTTISFALLNQGGEAAGRSETHIYYSSDNQLSIQDDTRLDILQHNGLSEGRSFQLSLPVTIPNAVEPGDRFIFLLADAGSDVEETDENDNIASIQIQIERPGPDLAITNVRLTPGDGLNWRQNFRVDYTLSNEGNRAVGRSHTGFVLSDNPTLSVNDYNFGNRLNEEAALDRGSSRNRSVNLTLPDDWENPDGNDEWFLIVHANRTPGENQDNIQNELTLNNNPAGRAFTMNRQPGFVKIVGGVVLGPAHIIAGREGENNFGAGFTLLNVGEESLRFDWIRLVITQPNGGTFELFAAENQNFEPDQPREFGVFDGWLDQVGRHRAIVEGQRGGQWVTFEVLGEGANPLFFDVHSPERANMEWNPQEIIFANPVEVGQSARQTLRFTNHANAVLMMSFEITGNFANYFSIPQNWLNVAVANEGGQGSLEITFRPQDVANAAATLVITTNYDDFRRIEVPLSGRGTGEGEIAVDDEPIEFAQTQVGETNIQATFVRNRGNAYLDFGVPTIEGRDADDFGFYREVGEFGIAPNGFRMLSFFFTPTTYGQREAELVLRDRENGQEVYWVDLLGEAIPPEGYPEIVINPEELRFGERDVETETIRNIEIHNDGELDLHVNTPEFEGDHEAFRLVDPAAMVIEGGTSDFISVEFTPEEAIEYSATIRIHSDAPFNEDKTVSILGYGEIARIPEIVISRNEIGFGQRYLSTFRDEVFVIENRGEIGSTLLIDRISLEGNGAEHFSLIEGNPPQRILRANEGIPGIIPKVRFRPEESGEYRVSLLIHSNSPNSPHTVTLLGTGIERVAGEDFVDRENTERLDRIFNQWSTINDIKVAGDLAFLAAGGSGLQIVNIVNPEQPTMVGYWDDNIGHATHLALDGDVAYLLDEGGYLYLLDISNPQEPRYIADCPVTDRNQFIPGAAYDLVKYENYLYVGGRAALDRQMRRVNSELQLIDVSDPTNPNVIGEVDTGGRSIRSLTIVDNKLLAATDDGLSVYSLEDPNQPDWICNYRHQGGFRKIEVQGNYAYCLADGLYIIDLSNLEDPRERGHIDTPGSATDLSILENVILIADMWGGLRVIDIADPDDPSELSAYRPGPLFYSVLAAGEIAFAGANGLRALDISNPRELREIGFYYSSGNISQIAVRGNSAYVVDPNIAAIRIVDVSDPESMREVNRIQMAGQIYNAAVQDNLLLVCGQGENWQGGRVSIYNLDQPDDPRMLGSYDNDQPFFDISINGNLCFASRNNLVFIINITDPNQPDLLSTFECAENVRSIASGSEFLYIGGTDGGVYVIDISDPDNPSLAGNQYIMGDIRDVTVAGSLLFAVKEGSMQILNITDPDHSELISTFDISGYNENIALREEYAFVANGGSGIRIVDVSDPTQPVDVGHYNTPGYASGLSISGRTIYVADRTNLGSYRLNTPAQDIGVSPRELNYGEVLIGESSELRLFIANEGREDLEINSIESDDEQFITNFGGRCVLSPDQQIELSVIFQPAETNVFNQQLTISSDDPNEREVHVLLTGVGVTPRLNINPEIVDFDEVLVGELDSLTMTLSNSGNADLIVSDISTEAPFSLVFDGEFTIEAGQSSETVITFTPEEAGEFEGTLTISTNDLDNETVQIPLIGRGIVQNHAPFVANPLPNDRLEMDEDDQQGRQIDLGHLFSDPDNDALDYSVVEVEGLSLVIDGSALVVTSLPNVNGEFQVTVGAEDMREEGEGRDRGVQRSLRSLRTTSDTSPIRMMRSLSGIRAPQRDASVSYSFTVVVHSIPDRPEITNGPGEVVTVSEGDTVLIDLTAADADGDHMAWTIERRDMPEAAELIDHGDGTALLVWATGYEDADEYAPLITVTDDSEPEPLSESIQIEIHVSNTNRAPIWTEVPDVVEGAVGDTIRFQVTGDDPDRNAVILSFQGDLPQNATFSDNGEGSGAFEWITQNYNPGEYSFTYLISDSILNAEASVIVILSPVNHAPEWVSIPDTVYVVEGDSVAFEVEADDPDDDELIINCNRQNLPRSARWIDNGNGSGNFGWRTDIVDAGEYLPILTLSDGQDEITRTVTIIVANSNQSPVWREIPDTLLASEGDVIEFIVAGEDADGDGLIIDFHSDDMPDSARFEDHGDGTGYFYWMTSADDGGDYSASITLSDGELTAEHDIQFSIIEANRPPVMANMEDYSVEEDDTLRFDLSAEDPDGNGIAYFVENLPEGADLTEAAFSWTPDFNQAGRYAVTFVVTDDGDPQLSDEQTISIRVENVNRPPVLAEIGDRENSEDEELIFDLSADDPDGDEVSFSAGNMPAGSTLRSSRFRWTPDFDQAGEYDITFIATDAGDQNLTDEETIRITVADVNRPPELIQPIGNRQFDEDCGWQAVVELNDHFIDPDGDQLSFEVEAADELGLQIDEEGVLSVSPDSNYNGSPEVTLIASDGVNQQRFLIVVPEGRFNYSQRFVRSLRQVDQSESATTSLQRSVDDHRWQGTHRDEAVSDQFMLTIVPVNDPPVILDGEGTPLEDDTVLDVEVNEGNPVELQLYASDVDLEHEGDSLQWEMSERGGLPAMEEELWRFIDDTGTQVSFAWRTVAGDGREEPYEPVFTVRDSAGAEDRIMVRIRVTEPVTRHFLQDDPQTEDREGWIRTDVSHSLLISSITLDGEIVPTGWEVGVFAPGDIPSGGARWITDQQVGLAAWGDDAQTQGVVEGFHDGERIDFRVWDDQANQEYLSHAEFEEGPAEWTANAFSVLHLSTLTEKRLEVPFRLGWNLISINVSPVDQALWAGDPGPEIIPMMAQLARPDNGAHHVLLMKNERGAFYVPGRFNGIAYWNLEEGYQVRMDTAMSAIWTGVQIDPQADVPIVRTGNSGWNMIAYFPDYELSARSPQLYVISPIRDHVVIAKDGNGNFMIPARPFSNMPPWREGQGYQINVSQNVVLNYPQAQQNQAALVLEPELSVNGHWADVPSTGSNMSVLIAKVSDVKLTVDDQVAAFSASGRLAGVGRVIDGQIGIAVWGDDPSTDAVDGLITGEAFTLKLWNTDSEVESRLSLAKVEVGEGLVYSTDAFAIVEMQIEKDIPTAFYLGDAYPNPFNSSVQIKYGLHEAGLVVLSVYDVSGRQVAVVLNDARPAGHHSITWNGESLVSGVYILRMQTSTSVATQKIVLMR